MTLVEILVALSLLAVVTTGAVPLFVSGIRASLTSRFETQAKNLAQERLELMRNLPYYAVSSTTGPQQCWNEPNRTSPVVAGSSVRCDYKDVLDTYFRSATFNAASTTTGGYVSTTGTQSADEVAAGLSRPYYRYVLNPVPNFEEGRFSQVIVSQFLNPDRTIVIPPSNYNTQNPSTDFPPSGLLGVTVITRWNVGSQARKYVTYTQITEGATEPTVVSLSAEATALTLRSGKDPTTTDRVEVSAGISRSEGTLAGSVRVSTYAQGGHARFEGTDPVRRDGAYRTASAPPPENTSGGSSAVSLETTTPPYLWATLRETETTNPLTVGSDPNLLSVPLAALPGTGTNWSRGSLNAGAGLLDLSFKNGQAAPLLSPGAKMEGLLDGLPVVSITGPPASGGSYSANGQTYLSSKAGSGHFAKSGAEAMTQEIRLLPLDIAPEGLIKIKLNQASIHCDKTQDAAPKATALFNGTIEYLVRDSNGVGSYIQAPFSNVAQAALPPVSAAFSVNPPRWLNQYIKEWGTLFPPMPTIGSSDAPNTSVSHALNGIVRIKTENTRPNLIDPNDTSGDVDLRVGVLSCTAEDKRP